MLEKIKWLFAFTVGFDSSGKRVKIGDKVFSRKGHTYRVEYNRKSCYFFLEIVKKNSSEGNLREGIALLNEMRKVK